MFLSGRSFLASTLRCFLLFSLIMVKIFCQYDCDVFDPNCYAFYRLNLNNYHRSDQPKSNRCNQQSVWLIPGRADATCTRPEAKRIFEVNPHEVKIHPEVIRLPGCFTIEINNIKILENDGTIPNSFFGKVEYQWMNIKDFSELKCQNASNNGCGGYGNNCYYCDICDGLNELDNAQNQSPFINELKGLSCPNHPGLYTFRKEFCFNDWSMFDKNGDCQLDFLQGERSSDYKSAFASLQQVGYGTIVARLRLAYNATKEIAQKRALKEKQIEEMITRELEEKRRTWDVTNGEFQRFQKWYINYRKNLWHKEDYLPWLLYENEITCIRITFDVCERLPSRSKYGKLRYMCDAN
ncbi:unnamed protein product [Dracunculus medinensis]|uniref:DUF7753 domain-containing protein n=1 Tax=Dracunculus medinensis TaxID=318479 RepID=A0A0N4U6L8_DRAME|nr:unnamed protein product [Dracunculus medinensis]